MARHIFDLGHLLQFLPEHFVLNARFVTLRNEPLLPYTLLQRNLTLATAAVLHVRASVYILSQYESTALSPCHSFPFFENPYFDKALFIHSASVVAKSRFA